MTLELRLLRELIALPSVNPAFLPAGDHRGGEQRVADFLAATAGRAGLDVEFQPVLPGRRNVVASLTPSGPVRTRVLLAPHMDTVGGDSPDLFIPRQHQGRVYGRGACDTKGSVAVMLTALVDLARSVSRPRQTEVTFVGLVDEENLQAGSRAWVRDGRGADLAIVGEPTRLRVVTAHKGNLWLQIETRGRSAHGSCPELGKNAIREMARAVDWIEGDYARGLRRKRHPLLGHATANVGTICGGAQPNIVPDRCVISIDRRTLPGETDDQVRRELQQGLRHQQISGRLIGLRPATCPALETSPSIPLVRALLTSVGQPGPAGVNYFCDAAVLSSGGIPSVVFGPGDIAQAHTAHEWIAQRQLGEGVGLLRRFLASLP